MTGDRHRTPADGCWDGLALRIAPDRMMVGPEGAQLVAVALERIRAADRLVSLSPAAEHLRRTAAAVASSARAGHADVPQGSERSSSTAWITTAAAAAVLDLSPRQVRRLAAQGELGEPRIERSRLLVDQAEVEALAAERRSA